MAKGKWIGGFVGWMAGGPLGALAGYLLGSMFDSMLDGVNTPENSGTWQSAEYQDYNQACQQRRMQGDRMFHCSWSSSGVSPNTRKWKTR